jgi:hypothetical protein
MVVGRGFSWIMFRISFVAAPYLLNLSPVLTATKIFAHEKYPRRNNLNASNVFDSTYDSLKLYQVLSTFTITRLIYHITKDLSHHGQEQET